jgi:glutamine synthetase
VRTRGTVVFGDHMRADPREQEARAGQMTAALRADGVRGVVLSFVDTAGIARIKTVPVARLARAARWGVGMSTVFDVFLSDDTMTATDELGGPDGDLRLVPDLDRLVPLAGQPGWAWAPVDRYTQTGEVWPACPRGFARAMMDRAAVAGLTFDMAIEVEWAVGRGDTADFAPACTGPAYGMTRLIELSDYTRDLLAALEDQGVAVDQLHPEYAGGQFEVSVAAQDLVGAADDSVLVRQTIRAVSQRHGLRTSFAPSVVAGQVGNGGHVHLSARRDGGNLFTGGPGPYGLTTAGEAMAAGILNRLPALLAIGAPSPASYLRLVPSRWAGAYACWGLETREAALRLVTGNAGLESAAANLEVKCFDLAANPYLLTGALVAAALDGLDRAERLPPPVTGDPARFSAGELAARGIRRLPASLAEATDAFAEAPALRAALGDMLADAVVAVRRAEAARVRDAGPEQVAAAFRWLY